MKKLIIVGFLLIIVVLCSDNVNAATGHDSFSDIMFYDSGKLLVDMTSKEIDKGYEMMKGRLFWGYKTHYFTLEEEASYIAEIIFAKSNRTKQPIKVEYTLQEKESTENSFKVTGSLSGNIEGKVKSATVKGSASAGVTNETKDSYSRFEETSFDVIVEPNHRLIFHVTGDCVVTNGVTKVYLFWMAVSKGSWESIEVSTRYYELLEEEIKE
jgi:hypothetical protein